MATSDVEIVNVALSALGDQPITALSEDTNRARLANRIYIPTRDALLRSHPWNCAIARATLGLLGTSPTYGWDYQYQLPNDCLRVLALNDDEELGYPGDEFKIEERMLLSNESTASIRYIKRITDPAKFDALFARALSYQLAAVMAYPITGSTTVSASMLALVDGVLREARTIDGQEGSPDKQDVNILGDVR